MRKLDSWLLGALDYTAKLKSPEIFRLWSAICTVAGALQRRTFTFIEHQKQFPNLYVFLVGPPGIGKGNAIKPLRRVLRRAATISIAPDEMTKAAFYDELERRMKESIVIDRATNDITMSAAITAYIDELGVFLKPDDKDFMVFLAHLYDNPESLVYKTRHAGEVNLENVCFNMLGACTPRWLRDGFTDIAIEQGLPARVILVHSDQELRVELFSKEKGLDEKLEESLAADLQAIARLRGEYVWSAEAAEFFQSWVNNGMTPYPSDARLQHYCRRRIAHITKLCMISAACRHDELEISLADIETAKTILTNAEATMHKAIAELGSNNMTAQMQGVYKFVLMEHRTHKRGVPEHVIRQKFYKEIPPQFLEQFFAAMVAGKFLEYTGEPGRRIFVPGSVEELE